MRHLIFLVAILLLCSCGADYKMKTVIIDNAYSVDLPDFLEKSEDIIIPEASLQYQNTEKEFYITVIDELKVNVNGKLEEHGYANNFKGYTEFVQKKLVNIDNSTTVIVDTSINNLEAQVFTASGNVDDLDIVFTFVLIEGKEKYYQVVVWTLANREKENKDIIKNIVYSFKEI